MDESGGWQLLGSVALFISLVLIGLPFLLRFRAGGQPEPFAGVPLERQNMLREQVQKRQVDSPQDGGEVRAMAELMRARRRDLLTPAGMATLQTTTALTTDNSVLRIVAGCVALVACSFIFTILTQVRAGSAFLQRYPHGA
ncbi:MAG TPA: hypothetical protein VLL08_03760 [Kineosporiaceae bacterium]|nr:hypothetical protein [Kineosporiaceae bacterium]